MISVCHLLVERPSAYRTYSKKNFIKIWNQIFGYGQVNNIVMRCFVGFLSKNKSDLCVLQLFYQQNPDACRMHYSLAVLANVYSSWLCNRPGNYVVWYRIGAMLCSVRSINMLVLSVAS